MDYQWSLYSVDDDKVYYFESWFHLCNFVSRLDELKRYAKTLPEFREQL